MIEERLIALVTEALAEVARELGLEGDLPEVELTKPRQKEHGDFATNVALVLAPRVGRVAPRGRRARPAAPARGLVRPLRRGGRPGVHQLPAHDGLAAPARSARSRRGGRRYGRADPTGRRAQVEFVSANPTGPLHIGHARNAALGDALARVLEAAGWSVEREYYFNDAGGQMDRFGASVEARYLQLLGREAEVPEDGYHGDYVADLARRIVETRRSGPGRPAARRARRAAPARGAPGWCSSRSTGRSSGSGCASTASCSNASLADKGRDRRGRSSGCATPGYAYDAEGAVWFRSTAFGDDKDRALVRSNGTHTYFGADCAYLIDKFARGFDHLVYVWGADHHGDVARVQGRRAGARVRPRAVEIVIYQWVSFLRDGEPVPMSKRAGTFVSARRADRRGRHRRGAVPPAAVLATTCTMKFDIEEVERQSLENPVYYVQYGHARIASILRKASRTRDRDSGRSRTTDLGRLEHEAELDAAARRSPTPRRQIATRRRAARAAPAHPRRAGPRGDGSIASTPSAAVLSDDAELTQARLWLCRGTKQVLANLLELLGVSAPESMERTDAT